MAQSRLEKVGTIYSRVTSLIKAGAMKEETQPFWLKIYEAFPPKYEPRYDRPISSATIRQIFYEEDRIRARFHKDHKHLSMVDLANNKAVSRTEQFIGIYKKLEKEGISEDEVYEKAVKEFMTQYTTEKHERELKAAERATSRLRRGQRQSTQKATVFDTVIDQNTQKLSQQDDEDMKKYKPIKLSLEKLLKDEELQPKNENENENVKKIE